VKFEKIIKSCHVRSSIYRESNPSVKYHKNHNLSFAERVPCEDQNADDWKEYDPADDYPPYYGMA